MNLYMSVGQPGRMNRMRTKSAIQLNTLFGGLSTAISVMYQISTSMIALPACVHARTLTIVQLMTLINTPY
ncbi:hypothetical protein BAE27_00895 [Acidithiobacillus caldus]|uniref:Uncharacterized protein n=2 Tax=Acidithiobacillus caldus TaxID=33059 RepID=A0A1E7YQW7_9PROT|nr:hypothetical protein BAE28_12660 [Acidithiobacillus caldus]OFC39006.1 hypothetical protein BAE27_00895 [Acidithiobacillus caldus]